jgi:hypothetical protein
MKVQLGHRYEKLHCVEVKTLKQASNVVRAYIEKNDLTAGCGSDSNAFRGGQIFDEDEVIAVVSYNGRIWDILGEREFKL